MKSIAKLYYPLIVTFLFSVFNFNCQENTSSTSGIYPYDTSLTNSQGFPKISNPFYFPSAMTFHKQVFKGFDSLSNIRYSKVLCEAGEPVLFNSYLGHDIYRFYCDPSFFSPIIITLNKFGDKVWLTSSSVNRNWIKDSIPSGRGLFSSKSYALREQLSFNNDRKTKILSIDEWNKFLALLEICEFETIPSLSDEGGVDGSEWIIEGHTKDGYKFVNRWHPTNEFSWPGYYLMKLSGVRDTIRNKGNKNLNDL